MPSMDSAACITLSDDEFDPAEDGLTAGVAFDELNGWSQSGAMRMVRCGNWKLVFDMQGNGQLYDLSQDPFELDNLFDKPELAVAFRAKCWPNCWLGPCAYKIRCHTRGGATNSNPIPRTTGRPHR